MRSPRGSGGNSTGFICPCRVIGRTMPISSRYGACRRTLRRSCTCGWCISPTEGRGRGGGESAARRGAGVGGGGPGGGQRLVGSWSLFLARHGANQRVLFLCSAERFS